MSPKKADLPKTLMEAHEYLQHKRPRLHEKPPVWVAFHRLSAEVYTHVSKTDTAHKFEAQHWAGAEIRRAREIEETNGLVQD